MSNLVKPTYHINHLLDRSGRVHSCSGHCGGEYNIYSKLKIPSKPTITGLITNMIDNDNVFGIDDNGHLINLRTGQSFDLGGKIVNGFMLECSDYIVESFTILVRLDNDEAKLIKIECGLISPEMVRTVEGVRLLSAAITATNINHQFYGLQGDDQWIQLKVDCDQCSLELINIPIAYGDPPSYKQVKMIRGSLILVAAGRYDRIYQVEIGKPVDNCDLRMTMLTEFDDFDGVDDIYQLTEYDYGPSRIIVQIDNWFHDVTYRTNITEYCDVILDHMNIQLRLVSLVSERIPCDSRRIYAVDNDDNWYTIRDHSVKNAVRFGKIDIV